MVLSIKEVSDRFEIQDAIVGYCHAVDTRDFDALDRIVTRDAVIDYSEMVGISGGLAQIKRFLTESLAPILAFSTRSPPKPDEIAGDTVRTGEGWRISRLYEPKC